MPQSTDEQIARFDRWAEHKRTYGMSYDAERLWREANTAAWDATINGGQGDTRYMLTEKAGQP